MGYVYADIELTNGEDLTLMRRGMIGSEEVKRISLNMLVDTGAFNLCINENIQKIMQFPVVERKKVRLANEQLVECDFVSSVEVRFKNRSTSCRAIVLPDDSEPLLGAIPLEDMDVIIDSRRGELMVHPDHPDCAEMRLWRIEPVAE